MKSPSASGPLEGPQVLSSVEGLDGLDWSLPLGDAGSARVVELFVSQQGEGPCLGERQIFLRLGGCNLHCDYCDSPQTIPIPSGELRSAKDLRVGILELAFAEPRPTSVSLTGGEPLLHDAFLRELLPWIRAKGLRTYLETNGTLPERLRALEPWVDVVSMDIKLPSSTREERWKAHDAFLRVAPAKTFVKLVVTSRSTYAEVARAAELVAAVRRDMPFILQPVTPFNGTERPDPAKLLEFLALARASLANVRLTPQYHPLWGVR